MDVLIILLKIIALVFLADVATGFFHFYVDRYSVMNGRLLGIKIDGLLVHHDDPTRMLTVSYWELTKGVYKVGVLIFGLSLFFGFYWELLAFLIISAHANVVHQWVHTKDADKPSIIRLLQKLHIIQTKRQHMKHHTSTFDGYYCVMTNMANPILQAIGFWKGLVKVFSFFGLHPVERVRDEKTGKLFID